MEVAHSGVEYRHRVEHCFMTEWRERYLARVWGCAETERAELVFLSRAEIEHKSRGDKGPEGQAATNGELPRTSRRETERKAQKGRRKTRQSYLSDPVDHFGVRLSAEPDFTSPGKSRMTTEI